MATANTVATANIFKTVYGKDVIPLAGAEAVLTRLIPFDEAEKIGTGYNVPVDLTLEHGWTYAAAAAGAYTLLDPTAGQTSQATVNGSQLTGRAQLDYETIAKAADTGNQRAFVQSTQHIVKRLTRSGVKRLEIELIHGQKGIGIVASQSGSGTTRAIVITAASWAAGIWAGMVGASLDLWAGALTGSALNTNAAIVIVSVDMSTRTINVSGNATDLDAAVAGTVFFFRTGSPTTEFAGLRAIMGNTGSLFGISASTYELWAANTYAAGGAITMQKVVTACAQGAAYGASGEMACIVSPSRYETLNAEQSALRQYDYNYMPSKGENGFEAIRYHWQNGIINVIVSPYEWDGLMHIFPIPDSKTRGVRPTAKRIGANDLSFIRRQGSDDSLIIDLASTAGAEMRVYTTQALFLEAPRHCTEITGITG